MLFIVTIVAHFHDDTFIAGTFSQLYIFVGTFFSQINSFLYHISDLVLFSSCCYFVVVATGVASATNTTTNTICIIIDRAPVSTIGSKCSLPVR